MNATSPTLTRVARANTCTGCGLCAGLAPDAVRVTLDARGYLRPEQSAPLAPAIEERIASACPGVVVAPWEGAGISEPGTAVDPLWGPHREVGTGYATDDAVRFAGSSGGVVTALALFALATGRVDRVVQVSADPSAPLGNRVVVHDDPASIVASAGSRYAPSAPLSDLSALVASGRRHLFIGKPCDVSALRALTRRDPAVAAAFPVMLSFFCAGVPSRMGAEAVVRAMGMDPADVTRFRYRGEGWPGLARAETADGRVATMSYNDSWGGYLSKAVQFRCKLCPDGVGGAADVACADAWYGDAGGYPSFDEADGRSLVMVRSTTGQELLDAARAAGAIRTESLDIGEIPAMQPSQATRKRQLSARLLGARLGGVRVPVMRGLAIDRAAQRGSWRRFLRVVAGTARRAAQRRDG